MCCAMMPAAPSRIQPASTASWMSIQASARWWPWRAGVGSRCASRIRDFDGSAYSASASDPLSALATPAPQVYTLDDRDTSRQAELRFLTPDSSGLLNAVFGVTYFEETLRYRDAIMPVRDFALALATVGLDGSFEHRADLETRSWSGYGELVWTPAAIIEVTANLRYTRDRKDIDSSQTATGLYSSIVGLPNISLDTSNTFENWSPGLTLAYKPDDALTLFAKYVRGFAPGVSTPWHTTPRCCPTSPRRRRITNLAARPCCSTGEWNWEPAFSTYASTTHWYPRKKRGL